MLSRINISSDRQKLIVYLSLTVITFAVFWQVNLYDFINFDDPLYVTDNSHIQSGITLSGICWAFATTYADSLWHPLIWLSLMLDHQLFGLNAGGYHITNLILHILSTLLLFWLFCRMTGTIWKSAFVAAFFAVHPMHVESVAWIAERKDVLSAFFWMLTLCLYVYYTEKPITRRYLPVLMSFACALMSKPMVVTLPVVMILLDYWPLKRFEFGDGHCFSWQLKEKIPFFILSALFSVITIYTQYNPSVKHFPFSLRIANASVSFVSYLEKTLWPRDLAVFYPYPAYISPGQFLGAALLIIVISVLVIAAVKRRPYLFVGWLWYAITLLPVIGIVQSGEQAMANRYHYLPAIGIAVMLAWGFPLFFTHQNLRKKILFPLGALFIAVLSCITWQQCSYWQNSIKLWNYNLRITKNNALAHNNLGLALFTDGKIKEAIDHYNKAIVLIQDNALFYNNRANSYAALDQYKPAIADYHVAIRLNPDFAEAYYNLGIIHIKLGLNQKAVDYFSKAIHLRPDDPSYYSDRGIAYAKLGQYELALKDYNQAIRLKPADADFYNIRGAANQSLFRYQDAINDFNEALRLKPNDAGFFYNRGIAYFKMSRFQSAIDDFNQALRLKPDYAEAFNNRGGVYFKLRRYQSAVKDFNEAIRLKPDYADAYNNRGGAYFNLGDKEPGCYDARMACKMGNCTALAWAKERKYCR
ncbi:MAG TPA: tetratricopeptide repeat protein [Smithella sp.]|nr:tetratricopeptide repeat protein [Smithella sp.]